MNTKKAFWVKRPSGYITIDLHSFSWTEDGESSVFWTVGEEGVFALNASYDDSISFDFVLLHTPSDYVRFTKDGIYSSFFSLSSFIPAPSYNSIVFRKDKSSISFYSDDVLLYKIENPAFLGSASFGCEIKGKGKVRLTVF